jgi:hypothetical protein
MYLRRSVVFYPEQVGIFFAMFSPSLFDFFMTEQDIPFQFILAPTCSQDTFAK